MDTTAPESLIEHFSKLEAPRVDRNKKHELIDVIVLCVCAVVSGAEGWSDIEEFGHTKLEWLRRYVPLANGIPVDDTIARIISALSGQFVGPRFGLPPMGMLRPDERQSNAFHPVEHRCIARGSVSIAVFAIAVQDVEVPGSDDAMTGCVADQPRQVRDDAVRGAVRENPAASG